MDLNQVIILNERDKVIKAPSFADFSKICRVCLNNITEPNACKNIYEEECKMRIKTLLEVYAFAKIPETEDSLPQNICTECVDFLIEIHTFRSRCKVNENLLIKIRQEAEESVDGVLVQHSYANIVPTNSKRDSSDFDMAEEKELYMHVNNERMGLIKCKDCHLVFSGKKELYAHRMEAKHSRRPGSACPYCGRMFNSTTLIQHIRTHTKEKPFVCELCNAAFSIKKNMQRHMDTHNEVRMHVCEMCGKSFTQLWSLKEHQIQYHPDKGEAKTLECSECEKVCYSDYQLRMHMRYHTKNTESFLCTNCGKAFSTKSALKTHTRVHTDDKIFACSVCRCRFAESSTLRIHMDSHKGAQCHKCDQCDKQFTTRRNLMRHQQTHICKTPHKCTICKKGFSKLSYLKRHFRSHNMVKKDEHENIEDTSERVEQKQAAEILSAELGIDYPTGEEYQEGDTEVYFEEVEDGEQEATLNL